MHSSFVKSIISFTNRDCISDIDSAIPGKRDASMSSVLLKTADPDLTKMSKSVMH